MDDQYFEFNDQGFSEQKSINGYLGADAIEGKKAVYILDRDIIDRKQNKQIDVKGNVYLCFSNNNVIFDVLSHVLSINQSRELFYRYSGDTETIRVVPFVNSNIHDVTGGEVNFLSRELYITVSNSIKDPSSQYFDFSDASLDAVNDPVSYNLSAVVVSDRGAVSILDKDDFDNAFSDDLIDNGAEIVSIKASHDAAYFLPHQVENAGYTVRAIYNREGKFSLHASDFEILAENNAITPYGTMKDTKLSSTVVGVFGQGGQFSFRSGPKGGALVQKALKMHSTMSLLVSNIKLKVLAFSFYHNTIQ